MAKAFPEWLTSLRDDPKARQAFASAVRDNSHPAYAAATKLLWAYTEGLPVKRVEVKDVTPQRQETGEQIAQRVWDAVFQLASVQGEDIRFRRLREIQGAEKLLNAVPVKTDD